ncbi:hypothetical protein FQN50_001636 [Emmonsiellopsis sp. PD_5]|nr:hypothetical protein FQN50_001636 [Emmonsiellopsis sp. PD_5]
MSSGLPSPRLPSSLPRPKSVSSKPQPQEQTTAPKPEKTESNAGQTIENTPANVDDELAEEFRELAISLRECDWEELQKRFTDAMNERSQAENALQKETAELLEVGIPNLLLTAYADGMGRCSSLGRKRLLISLDLTDPDDDAQPIQDLTTRFAGLSSTHSIGRTDNLQDSLDSFVHSGENVEDLLADLQSKISQKQSDAADNAGEIQDLLKKSKGFLNSSSQYKNITADQERLAHQERQRQDTVTDDDDGSISEDKDADEYLQRVLDKLNAEDHQIKSLEPLGDYSQLHTEPSPTNTQSPSPPLGLGLPSAPSTLRSTPQDQLSDTLDLPSAPTFIPADSRGGNNRWRDYEDTKPSWCCICSDDAVVKCESCEGDLLFCRRCWGEHKDDEEREGDVHRGVVVRKAV